MSVSEFDRKSVMLEIICLLGFLSSRWWNFLISPVHGEHRSPWRTIECQDMPRDESGSEPDAHSISSHPDKIPGGKIFAWLQ